MHVALSDLRIFEVQDSDFGRGLKNVKEIANEIGVAYFRIYADARYDLHGLAATGFVVGRKDLVERAYEMIVPRCSEIEGVGMCAPRSVSLSDLAKFEAQGVTEFDIEDCK